jgi:hypothetical protein
VEFLEGVKKVILSYFNKIFSIIVDAQYLQEKEVSLTI